MICSSPPLDGLYGTQEEREAQNEMYDVDNTRPFNTTTWTGKIFVYISYWRCRTGSVNSSSDPHQSLPTLTIKSNSLLEISRNLAETTDFLKESSDTFSDSLETESHHDLGLDLTGFEKTRDFGDFLIFSNSPAQVWFC